MKILFASDIHGSLYNFDILLKRITEEKPNRVVLLGDIYYHGPRNPLPQGYAPLEISKKINALDVPLVIIQGNCDSEVDMMITEHPFVKGKTLTAFSKTFYLTHGHKYNKDSPTKKHYDVVMYGHTHICKIERINDVLYVNLGSVSLPKEDSPRCYCIVENGKLTIKTLLGENYMSVIL